MEPSFDPGPTPEGELPPWEIAKIYAFHIVIHKMAESLDTPAADLLDQRVDEYIGSQVEFKGGGHPGPRTVRKVLKRCQDPAWYPGKQTQARSGAGRPPVYSEHQKDEVARVGMELKRKLVAQQEQMPWPSGRRHDRACFENEHVCNPCVKMCVS